MFGYEMMYRPLMYFCPFKWCNEYIKLRVKILRGEQIFILDLTLNGIEYNHFVKMDGIFRGVDSNGETIVIKLCDTDIITIIESDYEEVKRKYDKNCSDDFKLYSEREKKHREEFEKYMAQRAQEEKHNTNKKEEEARKNVAKAEEQRQRGFWYRLFHRRK